jgi:integrase
LTFKLGIGTAMRLREMYTLTLDQIQLDKKTIFLIKTKNGDDRQVPLDVETRALLARPWPALEAVPAQDRLLPFWDGIRTQEALKATTARVSKMFDRVFAGVRCGAPTGGWLD